MSTSAEPPDPAAVPSLESAAEIRRRGAPLPEPLIDPHPARTPASPTALAAHRRAVADGADGYIDPDTGAFCFTAAYHWAKGGCCELGCRHCPWVDADLRLGHRD